MMENITSKWWNQTNLTSEMQLDEVEVIDEAFQNVYVASLAFSKLILPNANYNAVETQYIAGVQEFNSDIHSLDGLRDELWAGYHPAVLMLSRLKWYGIKGVYHYTDAEIPEESEALSNEIDLGRSLVSLMAPSWLSNNDDVEMEQSNVFWQLINAAQARYALDTGMPLTFEQVVILSGMSRRAVQNDAAKGGPANLKVNGEEVQNEDALNWLRERRNFIPTTYLNDQEAGQVSMAEQLDEDDVDFIFVPVTDDGIAFLPKLRREGGYQIGKYGDEKYYQDYYEALAVLQKMAAPKFRRPNAQGNWGIKVSTDWKRVSKAEIDAAIHQLQ